MCSSFIPPSRATRNCGGREKSAIRNTSSSVRFRSSIQKRSANSRCGSANPADKPRININLFGSQADIDTTIRGIRLARKIFEQEPLRSLIKGEIMPGKDVQSDEALREFIYKFGATTQHPCGTCKMGHDSMAVVDDELRAWRQGIAGYRCVDHADDPRRPHQCADDHDRGKGRGYGARASGAGAGGVVIVLLRASGALPLPLAGEGRG